MAAGILPVMCTRLRCEDQGLGPFCRRGTSRPRPWSRRPHHAGAASIALTFCSSTSLLQRCMSGAPVASGSDTCIPSWRRPIFDEHWLPSATFSRREDILRSTDAQQFRRSKFQCCRPACVEQLATDFARFQHKLKPVWVLVNHVASWLFAILRHRNTLAYLLPCLLACLLTLLQRELIRNVCVMCLLYAREAIARRQFTFAWSYSSWRTKGQHLTDSFLNRGRY